MQPSVKALIWYFWGRSRRSIGQFVVLSAVFTAFSALLWAHATNSPPVFMFFIPQLLFAGYMLGGLIVEGKPGDARLPAHLMTLPVANGRYTAILLGYVVVVAGLYSCAVTVIYCLLFGNSVLFLDGTGRAFVPWQAALLSVCLACLFQSDVLLRAAKNTFLFGVDTLAFLLICGVPWFLAPPRGKVTFSPLPLLALLIYSWVLAYKAIAAHRCGGWERSAATLKEVLRDTFDRGRGRVRAFARADRALFWVSWKRMGRPLALVTAPIAAFFAATTVGDVYLSHANETRTLADAAAMVLRTACMWLVLPYIVFHCAYIGAILFETDAFLLRRDSPYFSTLPLRSSALAHTRLFAVACAIGLSCSAVATLFLVSRLFVPELALPIPHVAAAFLAAAVAAWLGFAFGPLFLFWLVMAFLCENPLETILFGTVVVVIVPAAVVAMMPGTRWELLGRRSLVLMGLSLIPAVGISGCLVMAKAPWSLPWAVAALLIPLPFAAAPLAVDWARHR